MNKNMKRRLTRCAVFLAAIIVTLPASGIVSSFVQAETTAVRIDTNAEYFSGGTDMRTVELTRASSNAFLGIAHFILTALAVLWITLFVYNGFLAVYEYITVEEKKNEEG
jgi:hypothetical protein